MRSGARDTERPARKRNGRGDNTDTHVVYVYIHNHHARFPPTTITWPKPMRLIRASTSSVSGPSPPLPPIDPASNPALALPHRPPPLCCPRPQAHPPRPQRCTRLRRQATTSCVSSPRPRPPSTRSSSRAALHLSTSTARNAPCCSLDQRRGNSSDHPQYSLRCGLWAGEGGMFFYCIRRMWSDKYLYRDTTI